MRIAIFHTEFAYSGGAEKLIFNQIDYLKRKGWEIDCFAAFVDETNCFPNIIKNYNIRQILPKFLNSIIPHDLVIIATILSFPLYIFSLKKYDIFLGENQAGPWLAAMPASFWRKPYVTYQPYPTTVTYSRGVDKKERRNTFFVDFLLALLKPIIVSIDKKVIRTADTCLANGEYAKRVLEKVYERKFVNCPGAAVRGKFAKRMFEDRFRNPYLLITNRHFPAKRLDYGIRLLSKLKTKSAELKLLITGAETEYTNELKKLAKKLKVDQRVIFTGLVDEKRLDALYDGALVYIYTAPEEDFGMGIIEAMARGVPIVAWDKAGPKYIIKNGITGYLAKPGDMNGFMAKVGKLLKEKELNLQMARKVYEYTSSFSWQNHGKVLEEILTKNVQIHS